MSEAYLQEIQKVELDLLEKFISVCKKYNIMYYADADTLLGAVRHKGFIPWDDDIDLALLWPDYQKLMDVAPRECEYPYFFQCIYTDTEALPGTCRLRRSDTTGFTRWEQENIGPEYDRGVFIDIFPLFYVPESIEERQKQKEKVLWLWEVIRGHDAYQYERRTGKRNAAYSKYIPSFLKYYETMGEDFDIVKLKEEYLHACAWGDTRTNVVGETSVKCHGANAMWDTEWFENCVEMPFENTTINCPAAYDEVLTRVYGDWRTPIKGASEHEIVAFDAKMPWRRYLQLQTEC